jgi:hypothetical protein
MFGYSRLASRQRNSDLFPGGVVDNFRGLYDFWLPVSWGFIHQESFMRVFAHLDRALPTFLRVGFLWDARYAGFMSQRAYMVLMSKDLDSFREGGYFE